MQMILTNSDAEIAEIGREELNVNKKSSLGGSDMQMILTNAARACGRPAPPRPPTPPPLTPTPEPSQNQVCHKISRRMTPLRGRQAVIGALLAPNQVFLGKVEHTWAKLRYGRTSVRLRSPDLAPGAIFSRNTDTRNLIFGVPGQWGVLRFPIFRGRGVRGPPGASRGPKGPNYQSD